MRFLKVLFWLLLGGLVAAFVIYNGEERVGIRLWGGLIADFSLPMLLILTFLSGFLPMLLAYSALRWRMRQRLDALERALADLRAANASTTQRATVAPSPETAPASVEAAAPVDDGAPNLPLLEEKP